MELDRRIQILQSGLDSGKIDEFQFAVGLKKFYDTNPYSFDTRSLRFMETKMFEAGLPMSEGRQGESDGILAQTVSGFVEGFTTFGFADTPDTSSERIANNVGHLIGLAPGIIVQGLTGTGAAVGVVKRGLQERAKKTGSKRIASVANSLENASKSIGNTNLKVKRGLDRFARLTRMKGMPTGIDPKTGEKLYGLQSFPGLAAQFVQKQATSGLHNNNVRIAAYLNKGLLKSKAINQDALDNIVNQSIHVGLLLAASAQPLGTRGEGFKGMAMAGVHGAVAGGIFGSIGEYVSIGRMLGSSQPIVRQSGERVVRSFAKALGTQPNRIDQYNTINFVMRGGAGAAYGTTTAKLNDLPLEDQIYETLMSVFFSVNSRASFENRATRDIFNSMNAIPRDYNMKKARKWLTEQPWYQNETPEYQAYWSRYLKNIKTQQTDYTVNQYNDIVLAYAQTYRDLKQKGVITPELEQQAKTDRKAQEKILGEMYDALDAQRGEVEAYVTEQRLDKNLGGTERTIEKIENKEFQFESMRLEDGRTIEYQVQEIDPLSEHLPKQKSLKSVFLEAKKNNPDLGVQDLHMLFKKVIDTGKYDINNFVSDVKNQFNVDLSPKQTRELIQSAHYLKNLDRFPIARIYIVAEGKLDKDKTIDPIIEKEAPETDIYDKPIGGEKSGTKTHGPSRVNKNYDYKVDPDKKDTLHYDFEYLTTRVLERYWNQQEGQYKNRVRVKNVAPLSVDIFRFIPEGKTNPDGSRIKPLELAEYMSTKQFKKLAQDLNKQDAFIYAANGETGRIQIRQYPFSKFKKDANYLSGADINAINQKLIDLGIPVTKTRKKSNVASLIWRMIETGTISRQQITKDKILEQIPNWIKSEPYTSLTKFQKRTKHHTGIEIALDPSYFKNLKQLQRVRFLEAEELSSSKRFTEVTLPLDVESIKLFLDKATYGDIYLGYNVERTYLNLSGNRASTTNNNNIDRFIKDNESLMLRVEEHNQKVLDSIESGSYKKQASFEELSFTKLRNIPEFVDFQSLRKKTEDVFRDAEFQHIVIEDLPSSIKNMGKALKENNSGTDGATLTNQKIFNIILEQYGYNPETGVMKTLGLFRPNMDQGRGQVINKTADFVMDSIWQKFADKHGIDKIHYVSGIKESVGVKPTKIKFNEKTGEIELVGKLNKFQSRIEDNYLNLNVYENFTKIGNQKLLQQIIANTNTFEMDPNTDIGSKFWGRWEKFVAEAAVGKAKETMQAEKDFVADKELSVKIDDVSIRVLDKILFEKPDSKAAQSIIKQIFEIERLSDFDKQLMQEWNDYRQNTYNRQLIEDYLIDTGFDPGTYLRPGVREYINERIQQYVSKRLTRPRIRHSYSSKLGLYDILISQRKQKYSKAKKGLANNEFMLNEGARDVLKITVYEGLKNEQTMTLGKFWDTWVAMKENPNSRLAKQNFAEYERIRTSVAYVRSPMISNGGMRIGEFVGFAKTRKGISLITNEYNDFMMSGADKDIDSAHMFWGLPSELTNAYKQSQVQDQLVRTKNGKKDTVDLKDADIGRELANAEPGQTKTRGEHLADILDTNAKLFNGKISTMAQDSIGLITNGVNLISLELDINKQLEDSTVRTGIDRIALKQRYKDAFDQLTVDRNVLLNTYIDAADLSNIDLPIVSLRNMRARYEWMYEGAQTGELEARRQAIKNMHKLIFGQQRKTDMPLDIQETVINYLDKTEGTRSHLGLIAEQYNGLRLELNPWNVFSKEQSVAFLRDLSKQISEHPIYKKVGLKDFKEHFMEGLTEKEFNNILDYEVFLWNKLNNVIDLSNALVRSQQFKDYAIKELEMSPESVDNFITQVVELTFEQRNRIYQAFDNNQKFYKKNNKRSYGDQIALTKSILETELTKLSKRRKQIGDPLPEKARREVEDLFDVFYIATPVVKKDFVGFRAENRFDRLNQINNSIKQLVKTKMEFEKRGEFFNKDTELENLYKERGKLQSEFTGLLPDKEQTWAIRPRNKKYMSNARYEVLKIAQQDRTKRIQDVRDMLDLDAFEQVAMDQFNAPPNGTQSKVNADTSRPVVLRTKKMVPELIDLDVLTDPQKLDNLIATLEPLQKTQTETMRKNLTDFKELIYATTVGGNQKFIFNLPSEYSFFLKRIDRKTDFIQNVDGLRFNFFMKAMRNKYNKDNLIDQVKRNKELIQEAQDTLYADITKDVPLQTFDEYVKQNTKKITGMNEAAFNTLVKNYEKYVNSWILGNKSNIDKLADKTEGMLLKDSDKVIYSINEKTKRVQRFDSREKFEKANNKFPHIQELEVNRLSDLITKEINRLNPLQAHLRDPKKLDQILGLFQRLDKEIAPFEQRLQFDRVVKFNEKTGQMEEYGITVPTSTLKTVADLIYKQHVSANQLNDFNTKFIGFAKKILNESQKGYKEHGNTIWEYAAVKHNLGEDGQGPKKGNTTPEELLDLQKRFVEAEKQIKKIDQKFSYFNEAGKKEFVTPIEYADIVRTKVIQPLMESALDGIIKSNYKKVASYFDNQTIFPMEYLPQTMLLEGHPKFWQQELGRMLLNKYGMIESRRLLWFDKTVRLSQDKQSGPEVLKNHFHYDDMVWIRFHLNLRDHIMDKYSEYITKGGNLNWKAMEATKVKVGNKNISVAEKARRDIARFSGKYQEWSSEVGKFQEDGVSDRYYPHMGQKDTAKNREILENEWLASEKKRIMEKKSPDQLLDANLRNDVKYKQITFEEAKQIEFNRLANRFLGENKFENPYVDKDAMEMLNQSTSRKGKNPYPGMGNSTHARSRLERAMPGWRSDGNVPLDYYNSLTRGLMQNIGAMYSRIYLDKFLYQSLQNPQMKDNARMWHQTMIDYTRGYMGFPSTRILEVHGVSKKEMALLKEWQAAGFDQAWKVGKLGPVEKKLLYDLEQQSIPTLSEQRMQKKKFIVEQYRFNSKKLKELNTELRDKKTSKERKEDIKIEIEELNTRMFKASKQKFNRWIDKTTKKNLNDFIKDENIDRLNISKTPRQWFSDESVGNVMLRTENAVSNVYGKITGKKLFKDLPDDIQLRHRALVDRAQYISDLEGRFELLSLLFSPKATITNAYGGYQNIITDTGFEHFFKAFDEKYLINEVFRGQKFKLFNPTTGKYEMRELKNKADIHEMIDTLGLLEGNLLQELTYLQANEPANGKKFLTELVKKVTAHTRAERLFGNSKEVNEKIEEYTKMQVNELAKKYNVDKKVMEVGSIFMSTSEKHLRRKAFLAHYLKAREIYSGLEGNIEVTDEFLVDSARKGVEGSQFIYHATYRPNFSNTAFGRIMTRFQPYAWNSIRRRKVAFEDMMAAEGHPSFEVTKRFQRQVANDMMTMALATLFPYSIFEYALSPPMSWMKETAEFIFGDEETRKKAFFNQYPIQALAPLQIITPPASRFILPHINGMINGDYEAFWKYTAWTYLPFGRGLRDIYKTFDNPRYAVEYTTGLPYNSFKWHLAKVKRQAEDREINEDPTT